jgi:hypothetical protein
MANFGAVRLQSREVPWESDLMTIRLVAIVFAASEVFLAAFALPANGRLLEASRLEGPPRTKVA